jgi:putative transposase
MVPLEGCGILKDELMPEQYQVDMQTMKKLVKYSIEIYNSLRPHYSCFMLTPDQMHKQKDIKIRTYKKENRCKNNFAAA